MRLFGLTLQLEMFFLSEVSVLVLTTLVSFLPILLNFVFHAMLHHA
jgi:hypothetical protein